MTGTHTLASCKQHLRAMVYTAGELPLDAGQLTAVAADLEVSNALLVRCQTFLERALASQGDRPDPTFLNLQHDIAQRMVSTSVPF